MFKISARSAVLTGGVLAVLAAPVALGAGENQPLDGGTRNPSNNPRENYTRETEVIANVDTYGTRQSNKSNNGGGAVYGCRSGAGGSPAKNEPCVRGVNLAAGNAFEFQTGGLLGGTIVVGQGGDGAKPFTTNATGVATGLNADRIDGRDGADFFTKDEARGQFINGGAVLFAVVDADGDLVRSRGNVTDVEGPDGDDTYTVVFERDISECSYTATQRGGTANEVFLAASADGSREIDVDQTGPDAGDTGFFLQVIC
jgi:hypothetical protein